MILSHFYKYSVSNFIDLFIKFKDPNESTLLVFKNSLKRIEKIYNDKLENLNLEFFFDLDLTLKLLKANKYSNNTIYSTISSLGKIAGLMDCDLKESSQIRNLLKKLREKRDEDENNNIRTEKDKENWIDIKDMLQIMDNYHENYLNNLYNINDFQNFLLLNLLVRQSPVRLGNYINCLISYSDNFDNLDNNYNYIVVNNHTYTFIFNKYKTAKKYGKQIQFIDDEKINELLDYYFCFYLNNNKYFLENSKSKELNNSRLTEGLNSITKKLFDKKFSVDMIRHIYITNFLEGNPTLKNKMLLASEMHHSLFLQNKYEKL